MSIIFPNTSWRPRSTNCRTFPNTLIATTQPQSEGRGFPCQHPISVATLATHQRWNIYTPTMVDLGSSKSSIVSHPLLIFLLLKAFERVASLFQTCFFSSSRLMLWLKDWVRESQIHRCFLLQRNLLFLWKFWFLLWWERRGNLSIGFFFYWVNWVNSEYQSSHPSPTDSRSSLGINLYLVSDLSRLTSRWIQLGRFFEPWFRQATMVQRIQRPYIHNDKRKAKKRKNEKTKKNPAKNRELSNCKKLS